MFALQRLDNLVNEYRGPLRADMRREYGIDLDAVLRPGPDRIHWRVLLDLIDGLPANSAIGRAMDPANAWSITDHMLATMIDQLNILLWVQPGVKGPRPKPVPRPGVDNDDTDNTMVGASEGFDTVDEFEAWYQATRAA